MWQIELVDQVMWLQHRDTDEAGPEERVSAPHQDQLQQPAEQRRSRK